MEAEQQFATKPSQRKRAAWKPRQRPASALFSAKYGVDSQRCLAGLGVFGGTLMWAVKESAQAQRMLLLPFTLRHFGAAAGSSSEWGWRWSWGLERRAEQGLLVCQNKLGRHWYQHFRHLCPLSTCGS